MVSTKVGDRLGSPRADSQIFIFLIYGNEHVNEHVNIINSKKYSIIIDCYYDGGLNYLLLIKLSALQRTVLFFLVKLNILVVLVRIHFLISCFFISKISLINFGFRLSKVGFESYQFFI